MPEVLLVPYDPAWATKFASESQLILQTLQSNALETHHIGSTAITTIVAKPIIDMLVVVSDIEAVDDRNQAMEALDYQVMGEYGIAGRRYFRKNNFEGIRMFHVHTFALGSPQIDRHLAFRDFMIAHPDWANAYSTLKLQLAQKHPESMFDYHAGKHDFIHQIDELARKWRRPAATRNETGKQADSL